MVIMFHHFRVFVKEGSGYWVSIFGMEEEKCVEDLQMAVSSLYRFSNYITHGIAELVGFTTISISVGVATEEW